MKTLKCLCGAKAVLKYKLKYEVYYCSSCRLYSAPSAQFEHSFETVVDESSRYVGLKNLRVKNFRKILNTLKQNKYVPINAKGLEVGSSYGWFLKEAKDYEYNCIGIEPEQKIWKASIDDGYSAINGFFPQDIPQNEESFDFIVFNDVLEHIPNFDNTVKSCHNLLSKNGVLIINIPISTGFFYKLANLFYYLGIKLFLNRLWQFNYHSPHFYYFNKSNLRDLLQKEGYTIIHYHSLETLDRDTITERIEADNTSKRYSRYISYLIKPFLPIINIFNEDIGCIYARKQI